MIVTDGGGTEGNTKKEKVVVVVLVLVEEGWSEKQGTCLNEIQIKWSEKNRSRKQI